ncbi:MAG: hypothetical protein ACI88H_000647 [Cocleimonas sp.]|jgi:hypothetical protein
MSFSFSSRADYVTYDNLVLYYQGFKSAEKASLYQRSMSVLEANDYGLFLGYVMGAWDRVYEGEPSRKYCNVGASDELARRFGYYLNTKTRDSFYHPSDYFIDFLNLNYKCNK